MRWLIALVVLFQFPLSIATYPAPSLVQQNDPVITPLDPSFQFGEQIAFRVRVEPAKNIKELVVFYSPEGQSTAWKTMDLHQTNDEDEFTTFIQAQQISLFPFSQVQYHFEVTLQDGRTVSSPTKSLVYADNRFEWKDLNSGIFQIHWNSDDATLGQEIANIAQEGLQRAQELVSVNPPRVLRIYAYASSKDLQSALQLTSQPWVAGHTTPELAMIMISIPSGPEKNLELRRQVPHEIMHILQYQMMGNSYNRQPVWLIEGMASQAELSEDPEYRTVLKGLKPDQVLNFRSLCLMFPREAAPAFQAYAQSASFISFLQQKFGQSGLTNLIETYKNGVGCEEGAESSLGFSLNQLQYRWEQEVLGINVSALALSNLLPYILVGLLILIPAALVFLPFNKTSSLEE